jgi:hypothetical protein
MSEMTVMKIKRHFKNNINNNNDKYSIEQCYASSSQNKELGGEWE